MMIGDFGLRLARLYQTPQPQARKVHFLHVGKCAGTAIKYLATQINALPTDPASAHRSDSAQSPPLSERALANLTTWYAVDIEYYRLIDTGMDEQHQA